MIMTETEHKTVIKEQGSPNLAPYSLLHLVGASSQGDFIGNIVFRYLYPTFTQFHLKG